MGKHLKRSNYHLKRLWLLYAGFIFSHLYKYKTFQKQESMKAW